MQDRYRHDQRDSGPRDYDGPRRGGGRGRGPGGAPPGGRGHGNFEKIAAMRRESRGAMLRRQISGLDLAESMLPPNIVAARDAALGTIHAPPKNAVDLASGPRGLMHDVFNCRDVASNPANTSSGSAAMDAGDLAVAVESSLRACDVSEMNDRAIRSKIGGSFNCRPEQVDLIRASGSKKS